MAGELTKRVAVAAVGVPLALVLLYIGGWPLALLLAAVSAAAATELFRLAQHRGLRPFRAVGALLAVVPVLLAQLLPTPADAAAWTWHIFVAATLVVAALAIFRRGMGGAPLSVTAVTMFGAFFAGGTLAYALFLRALPVVGTNAAAAGFVGPALLTFPLILTWVSDTAAYFGGRRFGRRKLIPSVSPGKTVEGAVAGVIGTVVAGAVYAQFILDGWLGVPVGAAVGGVIGLVVSPVAQLGDLAESLLKREAGVKDSGTLLPGHGGVLDRFDSLFFAIPATYWLLSWVLRGSLG